MPAAGTLLDWIYKKFRRGEHAQFRHDKSHFDCCFTFYMLAFSFMRFAFDLFMLRRHLQASNSIDFQEGFSSQTFTALSGRLTSASILTPVSTNTNIDHRNLHHPS